MLLMAEVTKTPAHNAKYVSLMFIRRMVGEK
jgi:hypothetical protein